MNRSQLFTGLVALAVIAGGCNRPDATQRAREAATDLRSATARAGDRLADSWLAAKVQAQFFADEDIKSRYIDVTARDGVVTLQGFVDGDEVRQEALRIARNTEGVREVNDRILIGQAPQVASYPAEPDGSAVATTGSDLPVPMGSVEAGLDDQMVSSLIQARYFRDPHLKSRHIEVAAAQGVVTLRGHVASENERAQALLLARTTAGVQRVEDGLAVDPALPPATLPGSSMPGAPQTTPELGAAETGTPGGVGTSGVRAEDTTLETSIRTTLANDAALDSTEVEVSARDGVVLLQGTVPTTAAKQRALTIAREADGVVQVVDRLRVGR